MSVRVRGGAGIGAPRDADRWTDAGGSFDREVADALRAAV